MTNSTKRDHGHVVQLDARNEHGVVTVTPNDKDRFVLRVGEAILACQRAKAGEDDRQRFDLLLKRLAEWVLGRTDVREAFLTAREGGLCFVAVRMQSPYDAEFEDALTQLDIELAHDRDIKFRVEVMSLPPVSPKTLLTFIHPDIALHIQRGKRG
jgi:hypothetical protein